MTCPSKETRRVEEKPARSEQDLAALIAKFYRHEIGTLMHQAEHWAVNDKPLAVHHRLHKADAYFQIVVLCERFAEWGQNPFDKMAEVIERGHIYPPGTYPASADLYRYRDPAFVVATLDRIKAGV
jgi:hypothetical protein